MSIVLFPYSNAMGHLIPMIELAKLFANNQFRVTILVLDGIPHSSPINTSYVSQVSSTNPSISFHTLPAGTLPTNDLSSFPPLASLQFVRQSNPLLFNYLRSTKSNIHALVVDMFCTSAIDVARQLNIAPYIFFSSGASVLSAFLLTPPLVQSTNLSFQELGDTPLHFPGVPPIPASHMPAHMMQDKDSDICKARVYDFSRLPMADGIMINTTEEMERRAVAALTDGSCYPGLKVPPIYCVGPLVGGGGGDSKNGHHETPTSTRECIKWLDEQPKGSVVLLSFGSIGTFTEEQLKEIGVGLENSGQRFLWVVRSPDQAPKSGDHVDLDALLPEGFVERTRERGLVVKSWAPQAEVLNHESVGGFVTHCGWNSVLEAVSCGVAMIAWPLYAEQRMNKVVLVEEMKVAVEMKGYDEELVTSGEVGKKLRWLMESEGGRELKARVKAMKETAVKAREEGGSSERRWRELVKALKKD